MNKLNYQTRDDCLMFGVGIRVLDGFDKVKNVPIVKTIDPLTWLPDPNGDYTTDSYRWHGFQKQGQKVFMTEKNGFIQSAVKKLKTTEEITLRTGVVANLWINSSLTLTKACALPGSPWRAHRPKSWRSIRPDS